MQYVHPGIESERLRFELLEDRYFEEWQALFEHKEIVPFLAMDVTLSPRELCQRWFKRIYDRYANDLGGMHVLIDQKTGQFIGQCGILIQEVEQERRFEVGYSILPQFWGMGYASEAAIRCKQLAFDQDYTDNLISVVHVDNIGSAKVARKNGMSIEKSLPDFHGVPVNIFRIDKQ